MRKSIPIGSKYGKLTILKEVDPSVRHDGTRKQIVRRVNAVCECGSRQIYNWYTLTRGTTVSCGCVKAQKTAERNRQPKKGTSNLVDGSRWEVVGSVAYFTYKERVVMIDAEDVALVSQYRWSACKLGYVRGYKDGQRVRLHRIITDAPEGLEVDHINHDPLDNRKVNLKVCTHAENMQNMRKRVL